MRSSGHFTRNKNVDRVIVLKLNGKDLLSFCSSSRYLNNLYNEEFFKGRIRNTGWDQLKIKYPKLTYRYFYAIMMYYMKLLKQRYNFESENSEDPKVIFNLLENETDDYILLIRATEVGELRLIKLLIEKGAYIHANGDGALRVASRLGYLEILKYLVERGGNVYAYDSEPLRYSAAYGHLEVVKYLIEKGTNIHAKNDEALRFAVSGGHLEVVKYLVECGANIHARNEGPLRIACEKGYLEIIKYLVNQGADTNGEVPLNITTENGFLELSKYLASL